MRSNVMGVLGASRDFDGLTVDDFLRETFSRPYQVIPGVWAHMGDDWGDRLRLAYLKSLRNEAARRELRRRGEPLGFEEEPSARLAQLQYHRWLAAYYREQDRQRRACEAIGLPWPPEDRGRPFVWCWEGQPGTDDHVAYLRDPPGARTLHGDRRALQPICYPHDWKRRETFDASGHDGPDAYGFGHRWREGEVLVIATDEIPVNAEVIPPDPEPEPAEVVIDADPEPAELESPERRALPRGDDESEPDEPAAWRPRWRTIVGPGTGDLFDL